MLFQASYLAKLCLGDATFQIFEGRSAAGSMIVKYHCTFFQPQSYLEQIISTVW